MAANHHTPEDLYGPAYEHDISCITFVADLAGRRDHDIVQKALTALRNLEHRGARGGEPDTGDAVGILVQVPDGFFRDVVDFELPEPGGYVVGIGFLPVLDGLVQDGAEAAIARIAEEEGIRVLGWRDLPVNPEGVGPSCNSPPGRRSVFGTGLRRGSLSRTTRSVPRMCVGAEQSDALGTLPSLVAASSAL